MSRWETNVPASEHISRYSGAVGLALNVVVMLIGMAVSVQIDFTDISNRYAYPTISLRMPIPDAKLAITTEKKIRDYLLNLDHPDGASKAVWFHSLGYIRNDWQVLADDLLAIARDCKHFDTQRSKYGVKYKAVGTIGRAGHRPGSVLTVWVTEDEYPPRLVTAYPEDYS